MDCRSDSITERVLRMAYQGQIFQVIHYLGEQLLFPPVYDGLGETWGDEVPRLYREMESIETFRACLDHALVVVMKGMSADDKSDHRQHLLPPDDASDIAAWSDRDREILQIVVDSVHDDDLPVAHAELLGHLVRAARILLASPATRAEASAGSKEVAALQRLCDEADEILPAE